jgi:hypothetical protein
MYEESGHLFKREWKSYVKKVQTIRGLGLEWSDQLSLETVIWSWEQSQWQWLWWGGDFDFANSISRFWTRLGISIFFCCLQNITSSNMSSFDYVGVCASFRCNYVAEAGIFLHVHVHQVVSMGFTTSFSLKWFTMFSWLMTWK